MRILFLCCILSVMPVWVFAQDGFVAPKSDIQCLPNQVNGMKVTNMRTYHESNGQLFEEFQTYYNDKGEYIRHGVYYRYHFNGQLAEKSFYQDGQLSGKRLTWYENGKPESDIEFNNGAFHGSYKVWYANGNPNTEGVFKNNERIGTWKAWDVNGELSNELKF